MIIQVNCVRVIILDIFLNPIGYCMYARFKSRKSAFCPLSELICSLFSNKQPFFAIQQSPIGLSIGNRVLSVRCEPNLVYVDYFQSGATDICT